MPTMCVLLKYLIIWTAFHLVWANNPCIEVVITKAGLDYARPIAQEILVDSLKQQLPYNLDPYTISITPTNKGSGKITVSKIKVENFSFPHISYDLVPDRSIQIQTAGGSITMNIGGQVYYVVHDLDTNVPNTYVKFNVDATLAVKGLNYTLVTQPQTTRDGFLQLKVTKIWGSVLDVEADVSGTIISWITHIVKEELIKNIKPTISSIIKENIEEGINYNATFFPMALNFRLLNRNLTVRYPFSEALVAEGHISLSTGLEIQTDKSATPEKVECDPIEPLKSLPNYSKMVYLRVSASVLNTSLELLHNCGYLKINLNKETSPEASQYLQGSCEIGECLGDLIEQLENYDHLSVQMKTLKPPKVYLKQHVLSSSIFGQLQISPDHGSESYLLRTNIAGLFRFQASFKVLNHSYIVLHGNIGERSFTFHNISSNIGASAIKSLSESEPTFERFAPDVVNKELRNGIKLVALGRPLIHPVKLRLKIMKNILQIESDLE